MTAFGACSGCVRDPHDGRVRLHKGQRDCILSVDSAQTTSLGRAIDVLAAEDPSPEYVSTDYHGGAKSECSCCGPDRLGHRYRRMAAHHPVTDEEVEAADVLREAMIVADVRDGDLFRVVVVRLPARPFGDRKVVWTSPNTYEREKEPRP